MNNISLLTYTHSKCVDLHKAYYGRIQKFFPSLKNNIVTCDIQIPYGECIVYEDNIPHSKQMINALNQVSTDYVIYSQEDYILFDTVDIKKLNEFIELLDLDLSIHFIRLIKSGVGDNTKDYNNELSYIDPESEYYFSTQVTIWRTEVLKEMYRRSNVWSIFDETTNSTFLRKMNISGLYTTKVGDKVGGHYNSSVYPYIATAKVKGQWNIKEYPDELNKLFKEYNIL